MATDFMAFWRLETLDAALRNGRRLEYAASNQYSGVVAGDTAWLVSVRSGRLRLIGRIVVGLATDRDTATRSVGSTELWLANHYILPAPNTTHPVEDIDIHQLVPDLRFSGSSDRLTPDEDGAINGQQLQAMRRLTVESARLLTDALGPAGLS